MDKVAVYAGTRNLYEQMFVCLKSLLANTRMDRVYLLIEDDEFPYALPDVCRIMNVSEQQFFPSGSPNFNTPWSYMSLMRCVLGYILPDEEHRVLWLDCDTIVNDDISDLFEIDMAGSFYAGAMEPDKSRGIFVYINAGVMLCNLDLLRESAKEFELASYLNSFRLRWADQDTINLLCQGHIRVIGSEYNQNAFTLPCTRPKVIHYAAVKDFQKDWAYQRYLNLDLFEEV